jgi:Ran GTPase-activating protein (RanGAP) involved in mRNA processing and transport
MESSLAIADDAEVGITCTIHRHDKGLPLNVVVGRADRIIDLKAAASQIRQDLDVRDILFYCMGMEEVLCDQVAVSDLLVVPSEPTVVLFMCPGTACSVQHPVHDALRQHVGSGCSLITRLEIDSGGFDIPQDGLRLLAHFTGLKSLSMAGCGLGPGHAKSLSIAIGFCRALSILNLSNNRIRAEGIKHVSRALESSTVLSCLHVGCNTVASTQMHDLIGNMQNIEVFCAIRIQDLRNNVLTSLDISSSSVGVEGALVLSHFMQENKSLRRLNIADNHIGFDRYSNATPVGLRAICSILHDNSTLKELNMRRNCFGKSRSPATMGSISFLAKAIKTNSSLVSLDFSLNELGPEAANHIAQALEVNRSLTSVTFSGDAEWIDNDSEQWREPEPVTMDTDQLEADFTAKGLQEAGEILLRAMLPKCAKLCSVAFCGHYSGRNKSGELFSPPVITMDATQIHADLSGKGLGNVGAGFLALFLPRCHSLRTLNIANNALVNDSRGLGRLLSLAQAITSATALSQLIFNGSTSQVTITMESTMAEADLSGSPITMVGTVLLSSFLPRCVNLQKLNLASTGLQAEGAVHIAQALGAHPSLSCLNMASNNIANYGDSMFGPAALGKALETNVALSSLDVSNNKLGHTGVLLIAKAANCSMTSLDVSANYVPRDTERTIKLLSSAKEIHFTPPPR